MELLTLRPRKKPALLAGSALGVICVVLILLANVDGAPVKMTGGLLAMDLALLIGIVTGLCRTRLTFSEEGVESISSAFSQKRTYRWKEVRQCILDGNQYSLYTKDDAWIGAFDLRNAKAKEALQILRKKHIAVTREKND